jgi:hypothetical protein
MLGYDFEIIYKKGKKNVVEEALSRKDEHVEAFLCAISIIQPNWITKSRDKWKNDEEVWTLIQRLQQDSSAFDTFTWKNDSLWYKYRIYLCNNSQIKQNVILELHTSLVGGQSILFKTYHRVKRNSKDTWKPKDYCKRHRCHLHWTFFDRIILLFGYSIGS